MTKMGNPSHGLLVPFDESVTADTARSSASETPAGSNNQFSAMERAQGGAASKQIYRFDLESLLYALFWIVSPDKSKADEELQDASIKGLLSATAKAHSSPVTSPLSVLMKTWVYDLACMFEDGRRGQEKGKGRAKRSMEDAETLGGRITYEKFMEILYR